MRRSYVAPAISNEPAGHSRTLPGPAGVVIRLRKNSNPHAQSLAGNSPQMRARLDIGIGFVR